MDTQRLVLLVIFSFSLVLLWDAWEKASQLPPIAVPTAQHQGIPTPTPRPSTDNGAAPLSSVARVAGVPGAETSAAQGTMVQVRTDLVVATINTLGGTLQRLELLKHKAQADENKDFVLLGQNFDYEAESGLIGDGLPNHRTIWRVLPGPRELAAGADKLEVRLVADGPNGLSVEKVYTFYRDRYLIDVAFEIDNRGTAPVTADAYFQLVRDDKDPPGQTHTSRTYFGPVMYTAESKYKKISFSDIAEGKADYPKHADDGWIGIVQHYFVSAWVPSGKLPREFYLKKLPDGLFAAGLIVSAPRLAPGASARVDVPLFAGPQEQKRLKAVAPGFDLVVDYGWLSIIAWPLFWLLEKYHGLTGNWGVAIILLTITVKLVFFPLSAASYKSMAKMKLVTPRMTKLREMYGNDRAKLNQAMMELYKTEKINPLGGCFPILVQIPVFIALYWVLLAAIELRHAPFIFWIKDLSALDPYYVLPILMTISMVIQTRMNPKPPDPVQAKVMTFMPFVFSVFFFFFPAGLVLYWLVNNILSILQQWQIQRMFTRDKPAHGKR
ncbi:MAG TPA: membrane protein insertase YidC [Burkholderiales bacterium]|nr:membrane protein insertase YidC [Burkholderiales bacterium]